MILFYFFFSLEPVLFVWIIDLAVALADGEMFAALLIVVLDVMDESEVMDAVEQLVVFAVVEVLPDLFLLLGQS